MTAAAVALSSRASGLAAWNVMPFTRPEPSTRILALAWISAWEV